MGAKWTGAERAIVRKRWRMPIRVEDFAPQLPGRTIMAIYAEARNLKLGEKTLPPRDPEAQRLITETFLRKRLSAKKAMSMDEIHSGSGFGRKRLRDVIVEMVEAGQVHIPEYVGSYHTALYKLGPGVNAAKPTPLTAKQIKRRFEDRQRAKGLGPETEEEEAARLDAKHRARNCAWWPKADPVVGDAMRAMVEAGRAAA